MINTSPSYTVYFTNCQAVIHQQIQVLTWQQTTKRLQVYWRLMALYWALYSYYDIILGPIQLLWHYIQSLSQFTITYWLYTETQTERERALAPYLTQTHTTSTSATSTTLTSSYSYHYCQYKCYYNIMTISYCIIYNGYSCLCL